MKKNPSPILPLLQRLLIEVGENIRLARLRRRFSASIVAERAGMTRTTLRSIERGDPHVMFGAYARVLMTLGLEKDLAQLARDDELGRKLQDAGLLLKARAPKKKKLIERTREKNE
jgi:transcriptional regulator with XRE-family HTH domain